MIVAAGTRLPAGINEMAGGGHEHEGVTAKTVDDLVDDLQHEIVGPVQVGQAKEHGLAGGGRFQHLDEGPTGFRSGPLGIHRALGLVAHQVQQVGREVVDRSRFHVDLQQVRHRMKGGLASLRHRGAVRDVEQHLQSGADGVPDVGLPVGHAVTLQHAGAHFPLHPAGHIVGQAGFAHSCISQQHDEQGATLGEGQGDGRTQQGELRFSTDERRLPAPRPPARQQQNIHRLIGVDRFFPAPRLHQPNGLVGDHVPGGFVGEGTDVDLPGRSSGLQPVGGVHHITDGGVLTAGPHGAGEDLAGVDPDAHLDVGPDLGGVGPHGLLHGQRGPHGPFSVVFVGERRPEEGHDGVPQNLVDPAPELHDVTHQPFETPVHQGLNLLRIHGLGQGGEPHQIAEQHRYHSPLVAVPAQPVPTGGTETATRGSRGAAGGAGHEPSIRPSSKRRPPTFTAQPLPTRHAA